MQSKEDGNKVIKVYLKFILWVTNPKTGSTIKAVAKSSFSHNSRAVIPVDGACPKNLGVGDGEEPVMILRHNKSSFKDDDYASRGWRKRRWWRSAWWRGLLICYRFVDRNWNLPSSPSFNSRFQEQRPSWNDKSGMTAEPSKEITKTSEIRISVMTISWVTQSSLGLDQSINQLINSMHFVSIIPIFSFINHLMTIVLNCWP